MAGKVPIQSFISGSWQCSVTWIQKSNKLRIDLWGSYSVRKIIQLRAFYHRIKYYVVLQWCFYIRGLFFPNLPHSPSLGRGATCSISFDQQWFQGLCPPWHVQALRRDLTADTWSPIFKLSIDKIYYCAHYLCVTTHFQILFISALWQHKAV